jgi:iron-sulfur cluster repair protein YtfE (RIC family)
MSTPAKAPTKTKPHDALAFLAADHAALLAMFRDYERSKKGADAVEKGKQALRLCHRLSIHCAIEEEIFYPAVASVLGKDAEEMLNRAQAEHGAMRGQIAKVEHMSAKDADFDPILKALGDTARRHFKEEEEALFPKLRHAGFDLAGTGERLEARQLQLSTTPAGKAAVREARRVLGS